MRRQGGSGKDVEVQLLNRSDETSSQVRTLSGNMDRGILSNRTNQEVPLIFGASLIDVNVAIGEYTSLFLRSGPL